MQGVTTQDSAPKRSTNCTTDLNKKSDTRGATPFLMKIRVSLRHTACVLARFLNTAIQSLVAAEIT